MHNVDDTVEGVNVGGWVVGQALGPVPSQYYHDISHGDFHTEDGYAQPKTRIGLLDLLHDKFLRPHVTPG